MLLSPLPSRVRTAKLLLLARYWDVFDILTQIQHWCQFICKPVKIAMSCKCWSEQSAEIPFLIRICK